MSQLADLAARYWSFVCFESPLTAIRAGAPTEDFALLREAPEDHERRAKTAKAMLADLARITPTSLGPADAATLALLKRELDSLVKVVEVRAHLRPSIYPLGPEFFLTYWANSTALATVEDAETYLRRLAMAPQALDGVCRSIALGAKQGLRYTKLVVERAIGQIRGQVAGPIDANALYQPLGRAAARSPALKTLAEQGRQVVARDVVGAFTRYADFLEAEILPLAREGLACSEDVDGEAHYAFQIQQFTTLDKSPGEIHQTGLDEVARLTDEMLIVAETAGFKDDLDGFRRRLQTDNRQFAESGEALLEQIEILSKRIDARIPEFFGRTPRTTYGVRSIPEAIAEKMPPAYAQPNPADGSAAGVHWVTSIPGKCPRYMHIPLALHEAWPGHLMHLALMQEMQDLPDFRRYGAMNYSACLEGWALYCERLGEDMGFYDTPEKRYGRLEMEMWRAVRLVVDTGIHAKGWSRDQALAYFQQHMAMPMDTIAAEVDRYIGMPGQALAYQLGNITFTKLRARAEAALGDKFRIRDFHDALMAAGPVTLPVLESLIDTWIETRLVDQAA